MNNHQPRTFYLQLLQIPLSSSSFSQLTVLDQNIYPICVLVILPEEIIIIFLDSILAYDSRFGKRPPRRRLLPNMSIQVEDDKVVILTSHPKFSTIYNISSSNATVDPVSKVFECFGLLELIFTFNTARDITIASAVNRRWYEAGRNDLVWKSACSHLWKDKCWMPVVRRGGSLAIYWRSLLSPDVIDRMSIKEIRCAFQERPMGQSALQERLKTIIEKTDMKQALIDFMPNHLLDQNGHVWSQPFRYLWFGSYVSSLIDSTRSSITIDELCCPKGFDMHFKVIYDEDYPDREGDDDEESSRGRIKLHFHSICYFSDVNHEFRMDNREDMMHHHMDLTWRWVCTGRAVQVGPYPPLIVRRRENWGWQLENAHVVLFSHE